MSPEWASLAGAVVGALIAVFASFGLENIREKRKNESRRQSVARTIASEIYAHKEAINALLKREESLNAVRSKFTDIQWQQYQNELWGLDPSLGVLFRNYYNELENMITRQFALDGDLEKEFSPLMELAEKCLVEANFLTKKSENFRKVNKNKVRGRI